MNLKAIRTLRKKFILMSTATYLLVMLFMGASINFINSASTRRSPVITVEFRRSRLLRMVRAARRISALS